MPRRPADQHAMEAWTLPQLEPTPPCLTSPLQYMLDVVNDETADPARRDKLAIAAAPYIHPKPDSVPKKARQAAEATRAGEGGEWEDDLAGDWQQ
jgi:hypothetical protein